MAKYMVLYNTPETAREVMEKATPEQVKASMDEWIEWRDKASQTAKVEFGLPFQAVGRVNPDGMGESDNLASGYTFVEADSRDAVLDLLKDHPHLKRPGAYLDVFELIPLEDM